MDAQQAGAALEPGLVAHAGHEVLEARPVSDDAHVLPEREAEREHLHATMRSESRPRSYLMLIEYEMVKKSI